LFDISCELGHMISMHFYDEVTCAYDIVDL